MIFLQIRYNVSGCDSTNTIGFFPGNTAVSVCIFFSLVVTGSTINADYRRSINRTPIVFLDYVTKPSVTIRIISGLGGETIRVVLNYDRAVTLRFWIRLK